MFPAGGQKPWKKDRRPQPIAPAITVVHEQGKAVFVTEDGRFSSHRELERWHLSRKREKQGEISTLQRNVKFEITLNQNHVTDIIAHQAYFEGQERVAVFVNVEDTPLFQLQKKLLEATNVKVVRC